MARLALSILWPKSGIFRRKRIRGLRTTFRGAQLVLCGVSRPLGANAIAAGRNPNALKALRTEEKPNFGPDRLEEGRAIQHPMRPRGDFAASFIQRA